MKKLHFVILLLFFCANNLLAQTPYDSFVSDAVKYPLLGKKEQSNFLVHAIDSTNAISYMSFNVKTGEASLFGHNNELIKTIVLDKLGDNSIFINALAQKGLTIGDLDQFEIYRYTPIEEISYDSCRENFPKLIRSSIPEEINKLNYNIRLNLIEEFIINKKQF